MSEIIEETQSDLSNAVGQGQEILRNSVDNVNAAVEEGKDYLHANPVPIIAGALALGFVLGLLVPREKPVTSKLDDRLDDLKELLGSVGSRVSSTAGESYDDVSSIIADVVKKARKRLNLS